MFIKLSRALTAGEAMVGEFGPMFGQPDIILIGIFGALHILAAASVVVAVFFAFKLYRETDGAWYWLSLLLSAFFFALGQVINIVPPVGPRFALAGILNEGSNIIGTLLLAVSCYGIYRTMKDIRKRVE
jgi:hypothetical protein